MRRAVYAGAAVLLLVESLVVGFLGLVFGIMASRQHMSVSGLSSFGIAMSSWIGQGILAVFLLVCAVLVALCAVRGAVWPFVRILLIVCAVLNGVLAALLLALSGWAAFALLILLTGALVAAVQLSDERPEPESPAQP